MIDFTRRKRSTSSGSFTTTSSSFQDVVSVSFEVKNSPPWLRLVPASSSANFGQNVVRSVQDNVSVFTWRILRDSDVICESSVTFGGSQTASWDSKLPHGGIFHIDHTAVQGTYTYKLQVRNGVNVPQNGFVVGDLTGGGVTYTMKVTDIYLQVEDFL